MTSKASCGISGVEKLRVQAPFGSSPSPQDGHISVANMTYTQVVSLAAILCVADGAALHYWSQVAAKVAVEKFTQIFEAALQSYLTSTSTSSNSTNNNSATTGHGINMTTKSTAAASNPSWPSYVPSTSSHSASPPSPSPSSSLSASMPTNASASSAAATTATTTTTCSIPVTSCSASPPSPPSRSSETPTPTPSSPPTPSPSTLDPSLPSPSSSATATSSISTAALEEPTSPTPSATPTPTTPPSPSISSADVDASDAASPPSRKSSPFPPPDGAVIVQQQQQRSGEARVASASSISSSSSPPPPVSSTIANGANRTLSFPPAASQAQYSAPRSVLSQTIRDPDALLQQLQLGVGPSSSTSSRGGEYGRELESPPPASEQPRRGSIMNSFYQSERTISVGKLEELLISSMLEMNRVMTCFQVPGSDEVLDLASLGGQCTLSVAIVARVQETAFSLATSRFWSWLTSSSNRKKKRWLALHLSTGDSEVYVYTPNLSSNSSSSLSSTSNPTLTIPRSATAANSSTTPVLKPMTSPSPPTPTRPSHHHHHHRHHHHEENLAACYTPSLAACAPEQQQQQQPPSPPSLNLDCSLSSATPTRSCSTGSIGETASNTSPTISISSASTTKAADTSSNNSNNYLVGIPFSGEEMYVDVTATAQSPLSTAAGGSLSHSWSHSSRDVGASTAPASSITSSTTSAAASASASAAAAAAAAAATQAATSGRRASWHLISEDSGSMLPFPGLQAAMLPSVKVVFLEEGDILCVCSDGIAQSFLERKLPRIPAPYEEKQSIFAVSNYLIQETLRSHRENNLPPDDVTLAAAMIKQGEGRFPMDRYPHTELPIDPTVGILQEQSSSMAPANATTAVAAATVASCT